MKKRSFFGPAVIGATAMYYLWRNDFNLVRTAKVLAIKALPFPLSLKPIRSRVENALNLHDKDQEGERRVFRPDEYRRAA